MSRMVSKSEIGLYCLIRGPEKASEAFNIPLNRIISFISTCKFEDMIFFQRLGIILESTIDELGVLKVSEFLNISENIVIAMSKGQSEEHQNCLHKELANQIKASTIVRS